MPRGPLVVWGAVLDTNAHSPRIAPNPEIFLSLLRDLRSPMSQHLAKQWEGAPRLLAALEKSSGKALTTALLVGEMLGPLSVLESPTAFLNEEFHQIAAGTRINDARFYEISPRLAVKS